MSLRETAANISHALHRRRRLQSMTSTDAYGTPATAETGPEPVAYTLWQRFLRYDPEQPIWPSRDRFVLSVGHASMLLNALPHLTGVKAVNPNAAGLPASRPASTLRSPSAGWRRPATVRASTSSIVTSTRSTATAA